MSHLVGQGLQFIDFIVMATALVMFSIGLRLLRRAVYFKFRESIIFSLIFVVFFPITIILFIFHHHIESNVFIWAMTVNIFTICYFLLFLHGVLVYFDKIPTRLLIGLTVVHICLFILNLSAQLYLYDNFQNAKWFGIPVHPTGYDKIGDYVPLVVLANGWVITGRTYSVFDNIIRVIYLVFTIIVYLRVKLPDSVRELKQSRLVLIIACICWVFRPLNFLTEIFFDFKVVPDTFTFALPLLGALLIAHIALNNPIRLMFTKHQIIQARRLYDLLKEDNTKLPTFEKDQEYLKSYLKDLEDAFGKESISG